MKPCRSSPSCATLPVRNSCGARRGAHHRWPSQSGRRRPCPSGERTPLSPEADVLAAMGCRNDSPARGRDFARPVPRSDRAAQRSLLCSSRRNCRCRQCPHRHRDVASGACTVTAPRGVDGRGGWGPDLRRTEIICRAPPRRRARRRAHPGGLDPSRQPVRVAPRGLRACARLQQAHAGRTTALCRADEPALAHRGSTAFRTRACRAAAPCSRASP